MASTNWCAASTCRRRRSRDGAGPFGGWRTTRARSPGDLFAAWDGERDDGRTSRARRSSAARWRCSDETPNPARQRTDGAVAARRSRAVSWPDSRRAALRHPERELDLVGVTGTNGKTTVVDAGQPRSSQAAGRPTGLLGTLGYRFARPAICGVDRTTPEASDLFRLAARDARRRRDRDVRWRSPRTPSSRVESTASHSTSPVFTNLTRDHFDFHGDMEDYFAPSAGCSASSAGGRCACVNVDDPHGRRSGRADRGSNRVVTFGEPWRRGRAAARWCSTNAAFAGPCARRAHRAALRVHDPLRGALQPREPARRGGGGGGPRAAARGDRSRTRRSGAAGRAGSSRSKRVRSSRC